MEPKTIIGIAMVLFIVAGLVFLHFRKKKERHQGAPRLTGDQAGRSLSAEPDFSLHTQ